MAPPPRSVWIDAQGCQNTSNFERGIARQAAESTQALLRAAPEVIHSVGLTPLKPVPSSLDFLRGTGLLAWISGKGSEPDPPPPIYHITSPFEGPAPTTGLVELWPHWARRNGIRLVITLHDLIPLLFPKDYIDANPFHSMPWLARLGLVRGADHILAVSQSSAADAVEHLEVDEARITVIDAGVSPKMASMVSSREEAAKILEGRLPGLRDGFLFYVGGDEWRKNMEGLIRAYSLLPERLRERHQLVITCKLLPARRADLLMFGRRHGIADGQVLFTGFVPDRELSALYRLCGLFVFPSLYEGAGLPILEAMSCGAPVVGSNVSSVPEILGDSRATFDPSDTADIARCLERTLERDEELERLRRVSVERAAHFTWGRVARKAIEGYERALSAPARRQPSRRTRKRLAIFTPWPPEQSSAATYNRQLVERLSEQADVDVFVAGRDLDAYDRSLEPRVNLWHAGDFDWVHEIRDFDRFLYVLGNSPLYLHSLKALLQRPGVVAAHEVRFGRLYEGLHQDEAPTDDMWLREKLFELYEERIPLGELRRAPADREVEVRFGIYMSREVREHAEKVLVHSNYAADALRMDGLPGEPEVETVVVHRGIPAVPLERNSHHGRGAAKLISHATGERAEAIDRLLHGFASFAGDRPTATLSLVGRLEEGAGARLNETVDNLGLSEAVRLVGHLEGEDYWRLLGEADLAVELQASADGEASGSVCDCLAARVPTIVSAVGWLREQPEPAVIHLPPDCRPSALAEKIRQVADDPALRERIRLAQDEYAAANSYGRVAEHYAELLAL
jgi:glycosyltransferase involved in cell wall biosynthesis